MSGLHPILETKINELKKCKLVKHQEFGSKQIYVPENFSDFIFYFIQVTPFGGQKPKITIVRGHIDLFQNYDFPYIFLIEFSENIDGKSISKKINRIITLPAFDIEEKKLSESLSKIFKQYSQPIEWKWALDFGYNMIDIPPCEGYYRIDNKFNYKDDLEKAVNTCLGI